MQHQVYSAREHEDDSIRSWQGPKPCTLTEVMTFLIMAISIFVLMPMAGLTVKNSSAGASKNDHSAVAAVPFSLFHLFEY